MSTTVTIPAQLIPYVRSGLYEHLQATYEALDVIITSPRRENPELAPEQQQHLDQFLAAIAALRAAGPATDPPEAVTISLVEHRTVLLKAIRAAAQAEQYLTEDLPPLAPRRQQARDTIRSLRGLSRAIKAPASSPPEDLYLQRLVVLGVLDQRHSEGRTRAELHEILNDYPAEDVDDATTHLAAVGLLRLEGERIHTTSGLERFDQLDLIGL